MLLSSFIALFVATAYAQSPTSAEYLQLSKAPVVLIDIAQCESQLHQFTDGDKKVLRGAVNPQDVGLFQINEKYWLETSKRLGYDIYTAPGNIAMALWIYNARGTRDWSASENCWGKLGRSAPARV